MTPEEYYGSALPYLEQGEQYLRNVIEEYPVKTPEGIDPVLYVKSRIKSPQSMMEKLKKKELNIDSQSALENTHDAIGIRVICSFAEEVYNISQWMQRRNDLQILEVKDYIAFPKPNGYRSLHLIVQFTQGDLNGMTAEIQLRTIAIDFWAVLEHQLKYKQDVAHELTIRKELKRCADEIASVDLSMQTLRDILRSDTWNERR